MAIRILAQRYNDLQTRIQAVLGTPTTQNPNTGYGQTLQSTTVSVGSSRVRAIDYTNLADDMARARYHQLGSNFTGIDPVIPAGLNRAKVVESYIQTLENLIPLIEADKDTYNVGQMSVETLRNSLGANVSSSRTTTWNTEIEYSFDVTFNSIAQYRSFFNTGGEIRFVTSSNYSGTEAKSIVWRNVLAYLSTIRFTPTQTIAANGEITSAVGGQNISTGQTFTLISYFESPSIYSNNRVTVLVNRTTNTTLRFTIRLTDAPAELDELVRGTITTSVSLLRANGNLSRVIVQPPIGTNIVNY